MTSQKAQIQALINGIDEVLNTNSPRLPWVMSNDAMQQRQVLEQTRQYLTSLQQQLDDDRLSNSPTLPEFSPPSGQSPGESAQQVLQAVLQEMNYWRVNMLQPLRAEIDSLQRQRETLTQELRQLDAQRQQYNLTGQPNQQLLMEFLQAAMAQMQANLSSQVAQMIAGSTQSGGYPPALQSAIDRSEAADLAPLSPKERLERLQKTQLQSDQLMLKLDSTLQIIFESLNRNVQTYQESLEQGLNRMHSLGQQGEEMFAFLVNRLAQQLGREASSFLQSAPLQSSTSGWPASTPATPSSLSSPSSQTVGTGESGTGSGFLNLAPEPVQASASFTPAVPFNLSEEVLDIAELDLLEQSLESQPLDNRLEALDLELSQLDLAPIPTEIEDTESFDLFAGDHPLPPPLKSTGTQGPVKTQSNALPSPGSDLDSALDLLNQLSAEMEAEIGEDPPIVDLQSTEVFYETELITSPDLLYDDAFYENLLQESSAGPASYSTPPLTGETADNSALALEQEWFGGLDDPASQVPSQPTVPPEFSAGPVSRSVENFLLNPTTSADSDPNRLGSTEPSPTPPTSAAEAAEPIQTIASLTELIPEPTTDLTREPSLTSLDSSSAENATQDEPLTIAEAPLDKLAVDLGTGLDSLGQLETDLAPPRTEALGTSQIPSPTPVEGLEGLFETVPQQVTPTPPPTPNPIDPAIGISEPTRQSSTSAPAEFQPSTDVAPNSGSADPEKKNY